VGHHLTTRSYSEATV